VNNLRSTLATVWRIAVPYFRSEDKWAARVLLAAVITIELLLVGIDVLINQWNNRFYNALQDRNWDVFVREMGVFSLLAACFIALAVYQVYLNQWLQIRWRRWLTGHYLGEWLDPSANHYRMQLQGDAADNPDQRVSDDVKLFVDRTMDIGLNLLNSVVTLLSFFAILWGLSAAAPLHLFGVQFDIPGYLVWGALIYAVFGTALTQWIGSPLVRLSFQQQRYEADFRFNLVRVRENSEQIALMKGEHAERSRLWDRFDHVVENWDRIYGELLAGCRALPLHPGGAGLFRGKNPARRCRADGLGFRQRAKGVVGLCEYLSISGGLARRAFTPRRIRDVDPERATSCSRHGLNQIGAFEERG
jgi:vitamin B12/bleomycin/antimicrobial peptide transport system ATP-binding/permease protein